jgi:hypothetical protein
MKNLNIYIIHSAYLVDRMDNINHLKETFNKLNKIYNVNIEIVDDYPHDQLNKEKIKNLIKLEPIEEENFKKYNNFLRNLTPQSLSKNLKHYKCLQEIKKKDQNDINLVLDDDVTVEDNNFKDNFSLIISKLNKDFDICMLGLPSASNLIVKDTFTIIDSKLIYSTLPGCDSYLISSNGANKIFTEFIPIRFELNIQLSYAAEKKNIIINQLSPNIMVEGSKVGKYKSTTNVNNVPLYNFKYKELNNLILKPNLENDDKQKINVLLEDDFLKDNPDFIYLKALYHFKNEEYQDSLKLFNKVYEIYKNMGLQLNKDSNFLLNMVEIFKFVQ